MNFGLWAALVGLLLTVMGLSDTVLARLPLSTSMLYLAVGAVLGPWLFDLAAPTPQRYSVLLEHVAEVVVLLSLFTSGLKMSLGLGDGRWLPPLRLAVLSMLITVALVAATGVWLLGLPVGAAVLLGGILAPTDPVLASDVQVSNTSDRDSIRFSLTGEAGLNDGTAFPLVMLGLGLLGLHDIGALGWRWVAVDVVWATASGLAIGALLGSGVGRLVIHLRRMHEEAVGLDNFLALGLIGLAYGLTVLAHGYGFLAVFAAGVALRRIERRETSQAAGRHEDDEDDAPSRPWEDSAGDEPVARAEEIAVHPRHAPAYMAHAMLRFNEQIERIGEVAIVLAIGLLLWAVEWRYASIWLIVLLFVVVRPLAVRLGLAGSRGVTPAQRRLIGWFGIRGIGSLYYLMYAVNHGLDPSTADVLTAITLSVMVASIVVHGVSVTPLMEFYDRTQRARRRQRRDS